MNRLDELNKLIEDREAMVDDEALSSDEGTEDNPLKKQVMVEVGKAVEALYNLDIALSKLYVGDKGAGDTALAELRTAHLRKALDALHTGDLLDLVDKIENTEGNEDE